MISFKIFRGEKDDSEIIFIQKEEEEPKKLIFDTIKEYSFMLLKEAIDGKDSSYNISVVDPSLESYKQIVDKVFNSIINDAELKELFLETSQNKKE